MMSYCSFCYDILDSKKIVHEVEIKTKNGIEKELVCRRCWFKFFLNKVKRFFRIIK